MAYRQSRRWACIAFFLTFLAPALYLGGRDSVFMACQGRRAEFRMEEEVDLFHSPSLGEGVLMQVQPYLFFNGRCEEAMEFYRRVLGAQGVHIVRFKENPNPAMNPPGSAEKVMHASFKVGDSTILASDGRCEGQPKMEGFSLSLTVSNDAEAERLFSGLADGGHVQMPMGKTFFSSRFGMVADRFGVSWMIYVAP